LTKNALLLQLLILPALYFIEGCASPAPADHTLTDQEQACWIEHPINNDVVGQIGIARDIYIGGETPKTKSRKRALASLADYLAADINIDTVLNSIDNNTTSVQLNGQTVHFIADISMDGYIHSFATLSDAARIPSLKQSPKQCKALACDISACNPKWLCTPSGNGERAVLGVSYLATSPVEQHYKSIKNALLQAEYMYGVNIIAHKDLSQTNSDYFRYNILRQDGHIDTGKKESLSYAVTDRCFSKSTLFSRVALYGETNHLKATSITDNQWLSDPKYLGYDGAIGAVQRPVASGLISDQIKLAIKRAAIQLAFEKESAVSEELVVIEYKSGNYLFLSYINEDTDVHLKARVLSIHFKEGKGDRLEVFAWLARIN